MLPSSYMEGGRPDPGLLAYADLTQGSHLHSLFNNGHPGQMAESGLTTTVVQPRYPARQYNERYVQNTLLLHELSEDSYLRLEGRMQSLLAPFLALKDPPAGNCFVQERT